MSQTLINGKDEIYREVIAVKKAIYNKEKWIGAAGVEDLLTPYSLVSGNGVYGAAVEILTALQTSFEAGNTQFGLLRLVPLSVTSATVYMIRVIWGTGTVEEAEVARQFTTVPIISMGVGSNISGLSTDNIMETSAIGTKVWARCKNATNLAAIGVLFGLREYSI